MPRVLTKMLAGIEDLAKGNSVEVQSRDGVNYNITQVSGETLQLDVSPNLTIKEAIIYLATPTDLQDISSTVNTLKKFLGREVFDSVNNRPLWAKGASASDVWVDSTGATVYTPV